MAAASDGANANLPVPEADAGLSPECGGATSANLPVPVADAALQPERPEKKLPEDKLNSRIFLMAVQYRVMRGFGYLALIWATIVLQGGFRVLMTPKDFWFVSVLVLVGGSRIFSGFDKPEDQIFLRFTQAILADKRIGSSGSGSWQRHVQDKELLQDLRETMPELISTAYSYVYFLKAVLRSGLAYAQLISAMVCIVLPLIRLAQQDFVKPSAFQKGDQCHKSEDDHKNTIRWSLNIFYGLVLAQGITFVAGTLGGPIKLLKTLCLRYKLRVWGFRALSQYVQENYLKCIEGNIPTTVKMDLVTFAKEKVNSDSVEDQLMGVRLLDYLLRKGGDQEELVLSQLRASAQTVGRVVDMLGFKGPDEDTRGHAANIVLELAPYLQIENFPGIVPSISWLLPVNKKRIGRDSPSTSAIRDAYHESIEFTWLGLHILEKLIDDAGNRIQVKYYTPNLLLNMVDLTRSNDYSLSSKAKAEREIVETSLKILQRLASTTGNSGDTLRFFIRKCVPILINTRRILEDAGSRPELVLQAARISASLALQDCAGEEIGCSRLVIRRLLSLLLVTTTVFGNDNKKTAAAACAAGQTLVYLLNSEHDYTRQQLMMDGLDEISSEDIKHSFDMLWGNFTYEHKSILANFLGYCSGSFRYACVAAPVLIQQDEEPLPKIMEAIKDAVGKLESPGSSDNDRKSLWTEQGKLLEGYIYLMMQICIASDLNNALKHKLNFDDVFKQAKEAEGIFMQTMKKILDFYTTPTTDFPGIRRVTLQLLAWMVKKEKINVETFKECIGMEEALKKALETATRMETFKLFYNGDGVFQQNINGSIHFNAGILLKFMAGEDVREIRVPIQ